MTFFYFSIPSIQKLFVCKQIVAFWVQQSAVSYETLYTFFYMSTIDYFKMF